MGQKLIRKCSLNGAEHLLIDERIYCTNKNGILDRSRAMEYCRELNATLPLPLSLLEFEVFSNLSGSDQTWIGLTDPLQSGKKENWRDVENKKPNYVKPRVFIFY